MRKQERTESQSGVRWDALDALLAVSELGGDDEFALTADLHACNTLVPSFDDFTLSELEAEGSALGILVEDLATVRWERSGPLPNCTKTEILYALVQSANISHRDALTSLGGCAGSNFVVLNDQSRG